MICQASEIQSRQKIQKRSFEQLAGSSECERWSNGCEWQGDDYAADDGDIEVADDGDNEVADDGDDYAANDGDIEVADEGDWCDYIALGRAVRRFSVEVELSLSIVYIWTLWEK